MQIHTTNSIDAFIAGGGPSGLAAAIALRRKGISVVVADAAQPTIDKACGEGIMPDALASLGIQVPEDVGAPSRCICFRDIKTAVSAYFTQGNGLGILAHHSASNAARSGNRVGSFFIVGCARRFATTRYSLRQREAMTGPMDYRQVSSMTIGMSQLMVFLGRHPHLQARVLRALHADASLFSHMLAVHLGFRSPLAIRPGSVCNSGWNLVTA